MFKKRVLYFSESYTTHDRRFIKALQKQTSKIWFSCLNYNTGFDIKELPEGIELWPGIDKSIEEWEDLIHQHEVDLIHAGPCTNVLPVIAGKIDCALIGMSWGSDILIDMDIDVQIRNNVLISLSYLNAIIVDCEAVKEKINSLVPDLKLEFFLFPWGVDLDRFKRLPVMRSRRLRHKLGWIDYIVFISTRTWDAQYGIMTLIKAFYSLLQRLPEARLVLIGDGPLHEQVLNLIDELDINDYVHIPGRLNEADMSIWYGAADIYVSSSLSDGSSVSLLEAMACGLPVITNNGYGNLEWVIDSENGWLANCEDVVSFSNTMYRAGINRGSWKIIGQRNRRKILDHADWRNNSLIIANAYEFAYEHYNLKHTNKML